MKGRWADAGACELGRLIGDLSVDPVELLDDVIQAVRSHPNADEIYVRVTEDRAYPEAEAASRRARAGMRLSMLDGVPISWKDLFDTAGIATEAGSLLLKGRVPRQDAVVVQRATALGLVFLGKTHLSELAFSGLGLNPVVATPPCINDSAAVPGGSSSGAAASIAFGLAPAAIGSDTGGPVRVPAAFNDLVGLKTTSGLLPLSGVVPLCNKFDTVGPLARNVEDASAILSALAGNGRPPDLQGGRLDRMRFLVPDEALEGVRDRPRRGFDRAIEAIRSAGARVVQRSVPAIGDAWPLSGELYSTEAYARWMDAIEARPELMFREIRDRFRSGRDVLGTTYIRVSSRLDDLRAQYRESTAGYDAVLTPTSPILPPEKDRLLADRNYYVAENLLALRNTRIGNLMEVPALTLPTGVPSTGVMLLGKPFGEVRLLKVGSEIEKLLG